MVSHRFRRWLGTLASLALALTMAGMTATGAHATTTTVTVDDAVTSGTNHFTYAGNWNTGTGLDPTRWHDGTEHWANSDGNPSLTLSFTGQVVRLYGAKDSTQGHYGISIDGQQAGPVDSYSPTRLDEQLLFESKPLAQGSHELTMTLTGEKDPRASRASGQIDYAEVDTQPTAVTGITMDASPIALRTPATYQLKAAVVPADATDQQITYSSANTSIATVSSAGLIQSVATGTTRITATTDDGDFTACVDVTVTEPPAALSGAVASTNYHYVTKVSNTDYQEMDYSDVVGLTNTSWSDSAWLADRVSGQFVLWTGGQAKTGVRIDSASLTGPGGATLGKDAIGTHFVQSVMAGRGRPSAGTTQEPIPDVLSNATSVSIAASSVQPIWITVDVPADAVPGNYAGSLIVSTDQGDRITFTLSLDVLKLRLPAPEQWSQFVDLWQNPYAAARVAGISSDQLWTQKHFDAMLPQYKRLKDAGQDVITTTIINDPWASQTYDPYGSMVGWTKKTDGSWSFDFTVFDKWVEFMMNDVGITGEIDAYSMVNWASKIQYYDQASGTTKTADAEPGDSTWTAMWGPFLDAFGQHLKAKGWFDKTYMAMDERSLDDIMDAVNLIAEHAPGLKVAAAMNYDSLSDKRLDQIAKISVDSEYIQIGDKQFEKLSDQRRAKGLITAVYYCTGDYPNTFVRSLPAEGAWVQWKTLATQSDGYLRWAYDSFVADPFKTTDYKYWESGDSAQIYPGNVSSVRWERMNEGIRDVEKARLLSERSKPAAKVLSDAEAAMANPAKTTVQGAAIGTGDVDIVAEVNRLESALRDATDIVLKNTVPLALSIPGGTTLQRGAAATAQVSGLEPGSNVTLSLDSAKTTIATAKANAAGKAQIGFTVPKTAGENHRLIATGLDANDVAASASLAIRLISPKPAPGPSGGGSSAAPAGSGSSGLAHTGADPAAYCAIGLALVLAGIALRRRLRLGR